MKHYIFYSKNNETEHLRKTQRKKRNTIRYYHYHDDCVEVIEIEPGDEGVTEEDITSKHAVLSETKTKKRRLPNGKLIIFAGLKQNMATSLIRPT